jgi:hypothetical protein
MDYYTLQNMAGLRSYGASMSSMLDDEDIQSTLTLDGSTHTAIMLHNYNRRLLPTGSPRLRSSPIVTLSIGAPADISNRHAHFAMMNTLNPAYCKIFSQIRTKSSWCTSSKRDHLHTCSRLMTTRFHSSQQENRKVTNINSIKKGKNLF